MRKEKAPRDMRGRVRCLSRAIKSSAQGSLLNISLFELTVINDQKSMPRLQQSTLPSRSNDRERDENHTLRPPSFLPPSSNYLHTRRPSWTPSLPEIPTDRDRERENLFMSSSYSQQPQPRPRPRKRRVEDISSFSPLERHPNTSATTSAGSFNFNFANPSPAINFFRRSSIVPGVVPENVERPRKRIISADAFAESQRALPDVAHVEPASPEDGSNLRRSLQIDMKGLVGDAVGNVRVGHPAWKLCTLNDYR